MRAAKASKKKAAGKRRRSRTVKPLFKFNPQHTALPDEEVQWLVSRIVIRGGIEPFVQKMVGIMDELNAGRSGKLSRAARRGKGWEVAELLSAMSCAVREGRAMAAYHTAFYAAHCAYQNSLDYLRELMSYLDQFRHPTVARN
jgi:hypothetical protein